MRPRSAFPERPRAGAALLSLLLGLVAPSLFAQTEDELFARAFGQKKKAPVQEIALRLLLGDRPLGTVNTLLANGDQEARLRVAELAELLRGLVRSELLAALEAAPSQGGLLPLSGLRALGIGIEIDAARLELYLELEAADREQVDLALRQRGPPALAGVRLQPARRSAYANLRFSLGLAREPGEPFEIGGELLEVETAADFAGTVLESRMAWAPEAATAFRRGEIRLVHDRPARQQRWLFGDLAYPVAGFQAFRPALGIAVAKDFTLDPYRLVQPLGEIEFLLESSARAEVLVNGRSERTLRLSAGRYRLSDFFLESGLNDVKLRLTDASGRVQEIDLTLPFERSLLRPGLSSYAAALGVAAISAPGGWRYEPESPLASGLYRRGITETFTLGGGLQADRDQVVASAAGVAATRFALLDLELAFSDSRQEGRGAAAQLLLERFVAGAANPRRRHWSANLSWSSSGFLPFGAQPAGGRRARGAALVRVSQRLGSRTSMGLSASFEKDGDLRPTGGATFSLRRSLSAYSHLGIDTTWRREAGARGGFEATLAFSMAFPLRGQQLRAAWGSEGGSSVEWTRSPAFPVGGISAAATLRDAEDGLAAAFDGQLLGDRGEAGVLIEAGERGNVAVDLRGAISVATAGGRWAVGRPISGAFALLAPHETLAGLAIGADRSDDHFAVRVRPFGGVVPDLSPYLARSLEVEVADLPAGYDPGPGLFQLLPRYKSGTVVPVGTGGVLAVAGRLLDESGNPVALASGLGRQAGGGEPKVFFTNRAGRFRIEGLSAGELVLELDDGRRLGLELPAERRGVLELGDLRLGAGP